MMMKPAGAAPAFVLRMFFPLVSFARKRQA
jgi:hypothetical protein